MRRLRDWRVVKLTGWTFEEYMDQPAVRTDWLLGVEDAVATAESNRQRVKQPKTRGSR